MPFKSLVIPHCDFVQDQQFKDVQLSGRGSAVLLVSDEYDKSCIQYRSFEREVYLIWVCSRIVRQSLSLHDAVVEHFIHSLTASLLNEGISKM